MDKVPETVSKVIDVLAQKFGTTGEYLWHVLVKYQFVLGVRDVGIGLVMLVVAAICVKALINNGKDAGDDNPKASIICGIAVVIGIICLIGGLCNTYDGIPSLLAPEGAAIMQVIGK